MSGPPMEANLEREKADVKQCFDEGMQTAGSVREHVYLIKQHGLYRVIDGCDSFKQYCGLERIVFAGKKIKVGYSRLTELATNGEVERKIPKLATPNFSDKALTELGKLRVTVKDKDGKAKKTHKLFSTCNSSSRPPDQPLTATRRYRKRRKSVPKYVWHSCQATMGYGVTSVSVPKQEWHRRARFWGPF